MDGKFTFRATEGDTHGGFMAGWESPHTHRSAETATVGDRQSLLASDDDDYGSIPAPKDGVLQAGTGHYHVHHHYHYHVSRLGSSAAPTNTRRRHAPPASTSEHVYRESEGVGLEQDPLTMWHSANPNAGATIGLSSGWMSEILSAHGIGQEWATHAEERARRPTALTTSSLLPDEDEEFGRYNPHWDDMMTFRQIRVRRERAWSAASDPASVGAAVRGEDRQQLLELATTAVGRSVCLTLLPVATVVLWSAVPLRTDIVENEERLNFWFFLLFYYGTYNAVALALVTQIFRVYSLTWWPRAMSGLLANIASWLLTTALGAFIYMLGTGIERNPMTWTLLTLLTLLLPVAVSFGIIQRHHRRTRSRRRAIDADDEQRPLMATSTEWRTPASYRRFLWFCSSFLLWYAALAAGELMASTFIATLPHTTGDEFFYVYTWIATVNVLSLAAGWVVNAKIRSWPLQYIYTLYFFTTYFIFYRNLFARLENPEQVVYLQLSASLWVALIYPLRMAHWVYRVLAYVCRWGEDYPYESYARQLGRAFFLRNKAENATVLGFLCWVTVLHYGPNRRHYPYFRFENDIEDTRYGYSLTVRASIYAWASEFVASRVVRCIFRYVYGQNISNEAVYDFRRYPHVVAALILVTIHVLQNILFAMINLNFT
ncbi:hypothetical protein LPJ68_000929 [Coemansia sp. RSA 1086]|nr:hypothetical protein LPJ68_000929 [Coemansia sp. RSA 1086]